MRISDRAVKGLLWLACFIIGSSFLLFGSTILQSPDETATYLASQQIIHTGQASIDQPLVSRYGWFHARSWVSKGDEIVPVGFIGWSWILSVFNLFGGVKMVVFGALLISACIGPLSFVFFRHWFSQRIAFYASLIVISFPTTLLYLNRPLFTTLVIVNLALILFSKTIELSSLGEMTKKQALLIGAIIALIYAIRPIEFMWIIPVSIGLLLQRNTRKIQALLTRERVIRLVFGFGLVVIPFSIILCLTYDAPFPLGYFLRDNAVTDVPTEMIASASGSPDALNVKLFAYGIHPRNILHNVRWFFGTILAPWTLFVLYFFCYERKQLIESIRDKKNRLGLVLICSGVALCIFYYGNGLYMDHVRFGAITVGNSFLRYIAGLSIFYGFIFAYWAKQQRQRKLVLGVLCTLCLSGMYFGFVHDDESIISMIKSSRQNAHTIELARPHLSSDAIIYSDRSDKLFDQEWLAVTPVPLEPERRRMVEISQPQFLFARPLSQEALDTWRQAGFVPTELLHDNRFVLYKLVVR